MKISVKFGVAGGAQVDTPPKCPMCHRDLHLSHYAASHLIGRRVPQVVFECPHEGCGRYFIATYHDGAAGLKSVEPSRPVAMELSEEFTQLTPRFKPIFDQCLVAKSHGLNEVVGMALRKALEVFLKDWLCAQVSIEPERESIRKENLSKTVKRLETDTSLGVGAYELADLARLIGNDETHIERRQHDLNHGDLEELIRILIGKAEGQLRVIEYQKRHQLGPTN